jgi:hypothetical protein
VSRKAAFEPRRPLRRGLRGSRRFGTTVGTIGGVALLERSCASLVDQLQPPMAFEHFAQNQPDGTNLLFRVVFIDGTSVAGLDVDRLRWFAVKPC